MNHSPCANLITSGTNTFWISASLNSYEILVSESAAYSLTTVSSCFASSSRSTRNTVLSSIKLKHYPSSSAMAKSTSSSSSLISAWMYGISYPTDSSLPIDKMTVLSLWIALTLTWTSSLSISIFKRVRPFSSIVFVLSCVLKVNYLLLVILFKYGSI